MQTQHVDDGAASRAPAANDNVGDPAPVRVSQTVNDNMSITTAAKVISEHYAGRVLKLRMCLPTQYVENGVIDFTDEDDGISLATARLRLGNKLEVDSGTGSMKLHVYISDIVFNRDYLLVQIPRTR